VAEKIAIAVRIGAVSKTVGSTFLSLWMAEETKGTKGKEGKEGEKTRTILPGVPVTGAGATITRIGPRIMINPIKPGKFPGAKVPHHNPSA